MPRYEEEGKKECALLGRRWTEALADRELREERRREGKGTKGKERKVGRKSGPVMQEHGGIRFYNWWK